MTHADQLTPAEKDEFAEGWGGEFSQGHMTEARYRELLGSLGLNATDIEQWVRDYRPASHV